VTKCAQVKFKDTTTPYSFKTILDLEKGDSVVVDTINGLQVAKVVKVTDIVPSIATKWVISKVDLEGHKERLEKEEEMKLVKEKMKQRKKELEEISEFEKFAEKDKEMADLLKQLKDLS
jgi:hypothetical protein